MKVKLSLLSFFLSFSLQAKINIALTVDDLPVSGIGVKGIDRVQIVEKFTKSLKQNKVKGVYGFLNGIQAVNQAKRLEVLKKWKEAGHYIGNHTLAHGGLSKLSVADYVKEIEKNETFLIDSKKHIYDKFFEEDTAFLSSVGKNYIYQALHSRKLTFKNFDPPTVPNVSKVCL